MASEIKELELSVSGDDDVLANDTGDSID